MLIKMLLSLVGDRNVRSFLQFIPKANLSNKGGICSIIFPEVLAGKIAIEKCDLLIKNVAAKKLVLVRSLDNNPHFQEISLILNSKKTKIAYLFNVQ